VHAVDVAAVCVAIASLILLAAILARQRYMLRVAGGLPIAIRVRGHRWIYGIGRYAGGELRWYRALGLGTKPSRVLERRTMRIVSHRPPTSAELASLPDSAIVVECRDADSDMTLALADGAFTGFISWLEASAPSTS
jgi:hypothetical protein